MLLLASDSLPIVYCVFVHWFSGIHRYAVFTWRRYLAAEAGSDLRRKPEVEKEN